MRQSAINTEYGKVFRLLRKSKNFTLAEAASRVISPSQLARFECGNSRLSTDSFFQVLNNINVEVDEFQTVWNTHNQTKDIFLSYHQVQDAYLQKNIHKLEYLLELAEDNLKKKASQLKAKLDRIIVIAAISMIHLQKKISDEDLVFVQNYLEGIQIWGIYELRLIQWTANAFDPFTLSRLTNIMLAPVQIEKRTYFHELYQTQATLNIINQFIEANQPTLAQKYILFLEDRGIGEYYMNEKLTLLCHKARLDFLLGDASALETLKKNLEIFKHCGCFQIAVQISDEITQMEKKLQGLKEAY
ncbi:MAG: hypothetical protein LBI13_01040 [Streptococcaceae bacterium]|nr:hypothetical protein [Streptococcaceae bacterium]